ncbi:MAG: acyl-ACP--UDP-N-acetylglucosamine O-acyltransferase [Gammaproteobacteria bacterium]
MTIHPTAIISDQADIAPDVEIGAYSVIDGDVAIGTGNVIDSHTRIGSRFGTVTIGERNYIQSGATLGGPPQDWSYENEKTRLEIGDGNRIGEYASVNLGSQKGGGVTRLGNGTFIMAYSHVGHDSQIGNDVVLTNLAHLAGHVSVGHGAVVGGMTAITQFARIGQWAFVAAGALVNKDILPFCIAEGQWATPRATNKIGLRRAGFSSSEVQEIDKAIRILKRRSTTLEEATTRIREDCEANDRIEELLSFIASSERGIARA